MKQAGKKLLAVLAAVALLLCAVPAGSMAPVSAQTDSGDEWEYSKYMDGEPSEDNPNPTVWAVITGYNGKGGDVVVPAEIDSLPVIGIGTGAFNHSYGDNKENTITSVTVPESVKYIGDGAFRNCIALTSVNVGHSVTAINAQTFYGCVSLSSFTIPANVTSIGLYAFYGCASLTSVSIPANVTSIDPTAFSCCDSLISITVEKENSAYSDIDGVLFNKDKTDLIQYPGGKADTSYVIPNTVTEIENEAFSGCRFTSVTIPYSLTYFGAFYNCPLLTSIAVDKENPYFCDIDGVLFSKDKKALILCPVAKPGPYTIPDSVTLIHEYAFTYCHSLTELTIGAGAQMIEIEDSYTEPFNGCTSLTAIHVSKQNEYYSDIDGVLFNKEQTKLIQYPCAKQGSFTIPDSVTELVSFRDCTGLTEVTIGAGVQPSNEYGGVIDIHFDDCSSLSAIHVSEQNKYYSDIDGVLFNKGQTKLIQYPPVKQGAYSIPDGVTTIDYDAFLGCRLLTSLTFPDSVVDLGGKDDFGITSGVVDFSECTSLTSLTVPMHIVGLFPYCYFGEYGEYGSGEHHTSVQNLIISDGCTEIGTYDFRDLPFASLQTITLPDTVTKIGEGAFSGMSSLKSVRLSNNLTTIEQSAFERCFSLTDITIPDSVTYVGDQAFSDCSALTSITVGNGITTVGNNVFEGCELLTSATASGSGSPLLSSVPNLKKLTVADGTTEIEENAFYGLASVESVSIPDSVTAIGGNAFSGWSALTSIDLPDRLTSVGGGAFSGCSALTAIDLPDGLTSIGGSAFYGCTSLNNVIIPNSVTLVGSYAFADCAALNSVTISENVSVIDDGTFYGCESLAYIVIPNKVTSIGKEAFSGCAKMTEVTMGNDVTSIEFEAFADCTALKSVNLPESVISIGNRAFVNCTSLEEITVPDGAVFKDALDLDFSYPVIDFPTKMSNPFYNTAYYNNADHWTDGILYIGHHLMAVRSKSIPDDVEIKPGTVSVYSYAFRDCSEMQSVTIPDSMIRIGEYAFVNCPSLTSVTVPESVTQIGSGAFGWTMTVDGSTSSYAGPLWSTFTVYGYRGSEAEQYAQDNNCRFVDLSELPPALPGDLNGDGEISTAEAQDFYIGFYNALANENPPAGADVNRDGRVDIEDVLTVYLIASGKTIA